MKKILLSLLLCITLFSVSCFATTMSESEIKSAFNDLNLPDGSMTSEHKSMLLNWVVNGDPESGFPAPTLSSNYIYYFIENGSDGAISYYDLGNSTIDNISVSGNTVTLVTSGSVKNIYIGTYDDFADYNTIPEPETESSITIDLTYDVVGSSFDTVFTYSGNSIFTNSSGGGLFDNIIGVMTSILGVIVPVATALLAIPLFKFIIYASVALGIIYFILKLLWSLTPYGSFNNYKKVKKDSKEFGAWLEESQSVTHIYKK